MIIVRARQLDRVIVTTAARGRVEALHARGPRRVRKKYARAIVFLRPTLTREHLPGLLDRMRDSGVGQARRDARRGGRSMKRRRTCESCLPGVPCVLHSSGAPFEFGDDEAATPPAHRRDMKRVRAENTAKLGEEVAPLLVQEDA